MHLGRNLVEITVLLSKRIEKINTKEQIICGMGEAYVIRYCYL